MPAHVPMLRKPEERVLEPLKLELHAVMGAGNLA